MMPTLLVLLLGCWTGSSGETSYRIDAARTYVGFTVRHLGVSEVEGRFQEVTGTLRFDPAACTSLSATVRIRTNSVVTDDALRDQRLLEDDVLNASAYPYLTFQSKRVERSEEGCVLIGDLTLRTVTREVRIPFSWRLHPEDVLHLEGTTTLHRSDYGLHFDDMMDFLVGEEVLLVLRVVAVPL